MEVEWDRTNLTALGLYLVSLIRTFFKDVGTDTKARDFTQTCKDKLGVTVELKNVFTNSIFYGKKNRFVAWADK